MIDRKYLSTHIPLPATLDAALVKRGKKPVAAPVKEAVDRFAAIEAVYAGIDKAREDINDVFYKNLLEVEPLTFSADVPKSRTHTLADAVRCKRIVPNVKFTPNRPLTGSDFLDFLSRILLAELGYFSCDLPEHRALREKQATKLAYIEEAYEVLGMCRKEQHRLIAAKMEGTRKDGIWARSTREYGEACDRLDRAIVAASPAIEQSLVDLG